MPGLLIYPNPVGEILNIELEESGISGKMLVLISDVLGKTVKQLKPDGRQSSYSIPVNDLQPGIYIVTVVTDKYRISRKLIIK